MAREIDDRDIDALATEGRGLAARGRQARFVAVDKPGALRVKPGNAKGGGD